MPIVGTFIRSSISTFLQAITGPASSWRTVNANETPVSLTPSCQEVYNVTALFKRNKLSKQSKTNVKQKGIWTCRALWTGAAPRYRGSKLGCMLTVPTRFHLNLRQLDISIWGRNITRELIFHLKILSHNVWKSRTRC